MRSQAVSAASVRLGLARRGRGLARRPGMICEEIDRSTAGGGLAMGGRVVAYARSIVGDLPAKTNRPWLAPLSGAQSLPSAPFRQADGARTWRSH